MATIETSMSIKKPVEQVFAYLADVRNQKALTPMITDVVTDGKMSLGSHHKIKTTVMGRPFDSRN